MDRIKEKSTWIGVVGIVATAAGYAFTPEQADLIATACASLAGLALIYIKERKGE